MGDENVFNIGTQNAKNIYNINKIAGDLNINENSPPSDIIKIIEAIGVNIDALEIDEKLKNKAQNRINEAKDELCENEPDKKSVTESIKEALGILKDTGAAGEALKNIGLFVGKAAAWLDTTAVDLGWFS